MKKNKCRIFFKFLGITYCVKIMNKRNNVFRKFYFGGLIRTKRTSGALSYDIVHNVYVCNRLVLTKKDNGIYQNYYLFNMLIKSQRCIDIIKNRYIRYIGKQYDHIYILNANSGEIYLFLRYVLDALIKKNKSKHPLLLTTRKYHVEMIKMICPDIPYLYLKNFYQNVKGESYSISNHTFYKIFSIEHFLKVEALARNSQAKETHYFSLMLETIGLNQDDISCRCIKPIPQSESSMLVKVKKIKLNLDNFVIVSPEALSCTELDDSFWVELIKNLEAKGFDVFVNIVGKKIKLYGAEFKKCKLSYSEAFSLAQRAKKLYSLRSGFTEFLLETGVPMEVYYTTFKNSGISAESIKNTWSLLKIPNVKSNLIKEIVIND